MFLIQVKLQPPKNVNLKKMNQVRFRNWYNNYWLSLNFWLMSFSFRILWWLHSVPNFQIPLKWFHPLDSQVILKNKKAVQLKNSKVILNISRLKYFHRWVYKCTFCMDWSTLSPLDLIINFYLICYLKSTRFSQFKPPNTQQTPVPRCLG